MIQSGDRDELITDKIIKNEYPDQNGYISNQLNITPADKPLKGTSAGAEKPHHNTENHGDASGIDTESQGDEQALNDQPRNPSIRCRVKPEKILRHNVPAPLVMNLDVYLISNPATDTGEN